LQCGASDIENIKIVLEEEQEQGGNNTEGRDDKPRAPVSEKIPKFFFEYCYHNLVDG